MRFSLGHGLIKAHFQRPTRKATHHYTRGLCFIGQHTHTITALEQAATVACFAGAIIVFAARPGAAYIRVTPLRVLSWDYADTTPDPS